MLSTTEPSLKTLFLKFLKFFFKYITINACVCVHVCVTAYVRRSEDNFFLESFHLCVGSGGWVARLWAARLA